GPLVQSVLYLQYFALLRLARKLFRREPAISVFDWLFTPTHTSSPHFSTYVGSGLQSVLPDLHPGDGCFTGFRFSDSILNALLQTAYRSGSLCPTYAALQSYPPGPC